MLNIRCPKLRTSDFQEGLWKQDVYHTSEQSKAHGLSCFSWWSQWNFLPLAQAALESNPAPHPKEHVENRAKSNICVCLTA